MVRIGAILVAVLAVCPPWTEAAITRLEPMGTVYPVAEGDLIQELQEHAAQVKLPDMEDYRKFQPKGLQGLPRAERDRSFTVDMTYTLEDDITGEGGKVLYQRGQQWNPLDFVRLPGGLIVLDGSDPDQIKWFEKSPYFENHNARVLLCGGYAGELTERWKRPVFYLTKEVTSRIPLTAVPSIVVQEGKTLRVQEVVINE